MNNDALKALVDTDLTDFTKELAAIMGVEHTAILRHFSEISKIKKMYKWIPLELRWYMR